MKYTGAHGFDFAAHDCHELANTSGTELAQIVYQVHATDKDSQSKDRTKWHSLGQP